MGPNSVLQLDGTVGQGNDFTFDGFSGAVLGLGNDTGFGGTLQEMSVSSGALPINYVHIEGHTVTITGESGEGTTSGTITLSDGTSLVLQYIESSTWYARAVSDGSSGTKIFLSDMACYCRGSRIATMRGEVAVEALRVGDIAITASGAQRPVTWLGSRRVDCTRHPAPQDVWPVCVTAGAFGDGLPRRDLWLSPGHNVFSAGVLIDIQRLVNGRTIYQQPRATVQYWHVELDRHDILLAEGLPAESYLDTGNRTAFENGGAFIELHPDFKPKHWQDTCVPPCRSGPEIERTKAMLIARAGDMVGGTITSEADPHIVADGRRFEPIRLGADRLAFMLPEGSADIALVSHCFVPAHTIPASADPRSLGLCVGRLQLDGRDIPLDEEALDAGWHRPERYPSHVHRWTAGHTPLPAGTRLVLIDLAGHGLYWKEASAREKQPVLEVA
ncbi:MAG: Hint domain-containing protein [Alphaproteobacteria bacterium]|nr:Hint domain-containing protein [Alphaproteobacteria bacterium]